MTDRGKVIDALLRCAAGECDQRCIYNELRYGCRPKLMRDAVELLKEKEPAKPKPENDGGETWWYVCGGCGCAIDPRDDYCRHCGRAVKWDE